MVRRGGGALLPPSPWDGIHRDRLSCLQSMVRPAGIKARKGRGDRTTESEKTGWPHQYAIESDHMHFRAFEDAAGFVLMRSDRQDAAMDHRGSHVCREGQSLIGGPLLTVSDRRWLGSTHCDPGAALIARSVKGGKRSDAKGARTWLRLSGEGCAR